MTKLNNNIKNATEEKNPVAISPEVQKQIEEQKAIEEAQRILNEQIEKFNKKKQLIVNREKFKSNKKKLQEVVSKIGTDYDDTLDLEEINIQLNNGRYNSDKVLAFSNTLIVREFIEFISEKIDVKVAEIEKEILNG